MTKPALLRVCARCEWIFEWANKDSKTACPRCEFGSYSAHYVHGRLAYKFKFTQEPWIDRQLLAKHSTLLAEVEKYNNETYPGWDKPKV